MGNPVIVFFEGEEISKNECNMHCLEEEPPGSMAILEHILKAIPFVG
jgi:hypothetical protein